MDEDFDKIKGLINEKLEVESEGTQNDEEQFVAIIAERVAELMESNMELFFNHLYRMDVDERKVRSALDLSLQIDESVYITIARLIYERQKQRLETRKKYKQDNIDYWATE